MISFHIARETEQGPIEIPQLLLLKCQLSGGWDTDLRLEQNMPNIQPPEKVAQRVLAIGRRSYNSNI